MKMRLGIVVALMVIVALPSVTAARLRQLSLDLHALNASGQDGKATIAKGSNGTLVVTITLSNEPAGASEPAHIHPGTCADINPVPKVVLSDVVDGKSVTTIPAPSATPGARSIVVHKGTGADMSTYVACGDIPMH